MAYEIKRALEQRFGRAWPPINIGQIYATLARLKRDGLVSGRDVAQKSRVQREVLHPA